MKFWKFAVIGILLGIGVLATLWGWGYFTHTSSPLLSSIQGIQILPSPSPSPFPFSDLTIPDLRNRSYPSSLAPLQKIGENSAYTSYLTSYESDDLKVNGLLSQPKGAEPVGGWPAIIFIHGYIPPAQYSTRERYVSHVDYLAKNGFVVFKIDLRGHGSSEGEPSGAYYSSDYIVDVLSARAALQNADFVHPNKIGLWGHSMAGNVVFRSLAVEPEIPAAVIWAGAVYSYEDFQKYGIDDNSYQAPSMSSERQRRRQELFNTYGQFNRDNEFWRMVVATNYVEDMKTSLQIHHAVNDAVVPIGYSRDLMSILDGSNVSHELHEYAIGGHNLTGSTFNQAMQRTVEFFKNHMM